MKGFILAACLLLAPIFTAAAQAPEEMTEEEIAAAMQAYYDGLDQAYYEMPSLSGEVALDGAPITLSVPENFKLLSARDTRTVLEDFWGNPPDDTVLGMLFPVGTTPMTEGSWGVVLTYEETGYVSDDEATSLDYADLLQRMQADTRAANRYRVDEGYEPIELVGWATPPTYDPVDHRLSWAKDLVFGDGELGHTLNYDMRVLGREGVFSMNFVAGLESLYEIETAAPRILQMPEFIDGKRYEDFQPGDKTAGYGIAALIAGGAGATVLKKAGFFAIALAFLKKGWVLILPVFAMIGGLFRRIFGGKSES